MKKDSKKTVMMIALISIVTCGCPGCFLLTPGMRNLISALDNIQNFREFAVGMAVGMLQGGWLICLGGLMILIPLILITIALVMGRKKEELKELVPTGVSKEDPIPPTR